MDRLALGCYIHIWNVCLKTNSIIHTRGGGEEKNVTALPSLKRCFYGECFGFRFWIPRPLKHDSFGYLLAVWIDKHFYWQNGEAQSEPPPPHQRQGSSVFKSVLGWGIIVYLYMKMPYEWKIFFKLFFVPIYIDLYITYHHLFIYKDAHIDLYVCIYTHTLISPSVGSWRALHAFFAKEVIKLCPQNIYNYKNVPVKVLNRKYDSLKAL